MTKKYIGKLLKQWRIDNNMSQMQVHKKYYIGLSSWCKAEHGTEVAGSTARYISRFTGIDPALIMELAEPEDAELEQIAIDYNKKHPFLIDYAARERLKMLKEECINK